MIQNEPVENIDSILLSILEVIFMLSNGNSFGQDGEGNERSILSSRWMFPGGNGSSTQPPGAPL